MIRFEGDRHFSHPVDVVCPKLSDAAFLVGCLNNVEQLVEAAPDRAVWKLRTGFSFLSASLDITLTVEERTANSATFKAFSKSVGATSTVRAVLTFQPSETGTTVHYVADVIERTGFLKIVSGGLMQSAAKSVIEDTWKSIEAKIG